MQLHQLQPKSRKKSKKRIGRGGKAGTYSGRGLKGQKARAGAKLKPLIRELVKRYPKKRGYRFSRQKRGPVILSLKFLNEKNKTNLLVSPKNLIKAGLIYKIKGRVPRVKILAQGDLTRPLVFEDCLFSKKAIEKIEKAGGTIKNKSSL